MHPERRTEGQVPGNPVSTEREGESPGGQGRRDEVGHSGVYPMSAPEHPPDAEIRQQAEWGQGERGAAGSADHGDSEVQSARPEEQGR